MSRERGVLVAGGAVLAVILLVRFLLMPAAESLDRTERRVGGLQRQLAQLEQLAGQLKRDDRPAARSEAVPALLPWLERSIGQAGLSSGLEQIAPRTGTNDEYRELAMVRLKEVDLSNLLLLLEKVEDTGALRVVRATFDRNEQRGVNFEAEVGLL